MNDDPAVMLVIGEDVMVVVLVLVVVAATEVFAAAWLLCGVWEGKMDLFTLLHTDFFSTGNFVFLVDL